ncbi:MAG: transposase [Spirochaetes bacterium]|nr:transposase [Spirochaetota bacterium]
MGRRRKYTRDFKESAVELCRGSGKRSREVAEDSGISAGKNFAKFFQKKIAKGLDSFCKKGDTFSIRCYWQYCWG